MFFLECCMKYKTWQIFCMQEKVKNLASTEMLKTNG